jgi:hypothetical protein
LKVPTCNRPALYLYRCIIRWPLSQAPFGVLMLTSSQHGTAVTCCPAFCAEVPAPTQYAHVVTAQPAPGTYMLSPPSAVTAQYWCTTHHTPITMSCPTEHAHLDCAGSALSRYASHAALYDLPLGRSICHSGISNFQRYHSNQQGVDAKKWYKCGAITSITGGQHI